MQLLDRQWAIVLAAGDGKRLEAYRCRETRRPVPKQFRRFDSCDSMLQWAIRRAATLIPKERIVCIVADDHRCWWESQLRELPASNIVVQPSNKGTAAGILLSLFAVLQRDPRAHVMVLPSDHFVVNEDELARTLREAYRLAQVDAQKVVLIGIEAGEDVSDYGWIVPEETSGRSVGKIVLAFAEKPDPATAQRLRRQGALVNSLILAATGPALLRLFMETVPELVSQFLRQWLMDDGRLTNVRELYAQLRPCDFSRDVLERKPDRLLVHAAPSSCGWVDLGTPDRVSRYLDGRTATAA